MVIDRRRIAQLDVLALAAALWFLAKLLRYAFPPLFEPLQVAYDVSNAAIGLAFTGFMLCYAAMQFPSGLLADRLGPVRVMVSGAMLAGIAAIGLIVEAGFALLVLVMLIIGTGTGLHKTVSVTLLASVYEHHTGRALGIHETVGTLAGVVAPIAAIAALGWGSWRTLFVAAGVIGLVVAAFATLRIPPRLRATSSGRARARPAPGLAQYVRLFARPDFAVFALLTILFAFTFNGVIAFLPLYLMDVADLSVGLAGLLFSLLFAVTVVQLVTGELSDRIGNLRVIGACVVLGVLGMALLLLSRQQLGLGIAVLSFGLGMHGFRPVRDAYLTTLVPTDALGGGIGLVRTLLMGAGALAPATVGILADISGFPAAFGILAGALGLGVLLVVLLAVMSQLGQ